MAIRDCEFWRMFIDLFKEFPELWQIKCKDFKNKEKKQQAWEILLKKYKEHESHATLDVVKRKILSMRSSYRRELQKIKQSKCSGAGSDSVYVPSLWYFKKLEFLKNQETQGDGTSAMDSSDEENEERVPTMTPKKKPTRSQQTKFLERAVEYLDQAEKRRQEDKADVFSIEQLDQAKKTRQKDEDDVFSTEDLDQVNKKRQRDEPDVFSIEHLDQVKKRRQKYEADDFSIEHLNQVNKRRQRDEADVFPILHLDQAKQRRERDEADIFSEGWAVVFRKLDSEQQIYAKQAIDQILFQGQLKRLSLGNINIAKNRHETSQQIHQNCSTSYSNLSEFSGPSARGVQPSNLNVCLQTTDEQIIVSPDFNANPQFVMNDDKKKYNMLKNK